MIRCIWLSERMATNILILGAAALLASGEVRGGPFHPSSLGTLSVSPTDDYYDGSGGTLFSAVALPTGATALQFLVTGSMYTDANTSNLEGPDGLNATGSPPYNWTGTSFNGTYNGTPVGSTTGIDPALFGVFFNPNFTGTPQDSDNYRSDSGISPDPRTLSSYSPSVNQPFFIGDGLDQNNDYGAIPLGNAQTFNIPVGATELLLGIGADVNLGDNGGNGYSAQVFDNSPLAASAPEPASVTLLGIGAAVMAGGAWRRRQR